MSYRMSDRLTSSRLGLPVAFIAMLLAALPASAEQAAADPIDTRLDTCLAAPAGQSTAGMVTCTGDDIRAWDRRLNETYQQAMKSLDPKSRELLRTSQRQWVAFRTAEKAAQAARWTADRGTMIRVQVVGTNLAAIKARVEELQLYLP